MFYGIFHLKPTSLFFNSFLLKLLINRGRQEETRCPLNTKILYNHIAKLPKICLRTNPQVNRNVPQTPPSFSPAEPTPTGKKYSTATYIVHAVLCKKKIYMYYKWFINVACIYNLFATISVHVVYIALYNCFLDLLNLISRARNSV